MSRSVRVSISGVDFSVRTDAKPKYIRELAAYVEEKVAEARTTGARGASTQTSVMLAAMSIADELNQLREEHRVLRRAVREKSKRILSTLEREAKA